MKRSSIGDRRRRLTIQEKGTPSRDAAGGEVISWSEVATMWAKEVPYSGREFMASAREHAEQYTRFSIRWRGDISVTPAMRCTLDSGSRVFDILSVSNVEGRNVEWLLTCREQIES